MRIVNRTEFLALPAGTVFNKYSPHNFGPLSVKEDTLENDFVYQDLNDPYPSGANDCGEWDGALTALAEDSGKTTALDYNYPGRDGLFDEGQLFAVYDSDDVKALIIRLQQTLED
jgi:hypothetical protein